MRKRRFKEYYKRINFCGTIFKNLLRLIWNLWFWKNNWEFNYLYYFFIVLVFFFRGSVDYYSLHRYLSPFFFIPPEIWKNLFITILIFYNSVYIFYLQQSITNLTIYSIIFILDFTLFLSWYYLIQRNSVFSFISIKFILKRL